MSYLSEHDGEWVSFDEIRRMTHVSPTALHRVMGKMVREGDVEVTREYADRPGGEEKLMVIYWYRRKKRES